MVIKISADTQSRDHLEPFKSGFRDQVQRVDVLNTAVSRAEVGAGRNEII